MVEFPHLEELVVGLHERGELGYAESKDRFIKLKSGRMSPNFFNGRGIMSLSPKLEMSMAKQRQLARLTVEGYAFALDQAKHHHDHIVNLPQAVNPIVGAVALLSGRSLLYLRTPEGEKGYGKHAPIEGAFQPGDAVAGIDNVISNGDTKREVTDPIEGAGLVIPEFIVLMDREEGGEAALQTAGYGLTKVVGMGKATEILEANNRIRPEQAEWSYEYIATYNEPVHTPPELHSSPQQSLL
jgi:orotate phosphoribosyltransferase